MEETHGMLLAISIINLIITAIGIIGIPYLIAKGKIRPGVSPVESMKFEIISEMHKLRSQGKKYCHIYEMRDTIFHKMRDTIFQKRNPRKRKSPTLKYLLQFDQALAELDMEKRIIRVDTVDISIAEAGKIEEKEEPESYQSPYSDTISQYGIVEESYLTYAIIPTHDLHERILEKRALLRSKGLA